MNHTQLINIAHALGYTAEASGITIAGLCKGFTMMWARAVCSGKGNEFDARMELLEHYKDYPEVLVEWLQEARIRNKKPGGVSDVYDKIVLDIPAFFEGIALYLSPQFHYEIFNEKISIYDEDKITDLLAVPDTSIATCHRRVKNYTQSKLEAHLIELAETLRNQPECVVEFNSTTHSVGAQVNEKGNFVFLDINFNTTEEADHLKMLELTPEALAVHLMEKALYFDKKNETLAMSTTIFSRLDLKDEIESKFQESPFESTDDIEMLRMGLSLKMPGVTEIITNKIRNMLQTSSFESIGNQEIIGLGIGLGIPELVQIIKTTDALDVHACDNALIYMAIQIENEVSEAILEHKSFNLDKINFHGMAGVFSRLNPQQLQDTFAHLKKAGVSQEVFDYPVFCAFAQGTKTDNVQLIDDILNNVHPETAKMVIQKLLSNGHDFMLGTCGRSPLHHVFRNEELELVKEFIKAGYNIDSSFDGLTPLDFAITAPEVFQLLLDEGAQPDVNQFNLVWELNPLPQETIKILLKHKSTILNMSHLEPDSRISVALKTIDDDDLKKHFVIKALETYIKAVQDEFGLGVFFSKEEKANAAQALLDNILHGTPVDIKHERALNDGRLGQIREILPINIVNKYRTFIQQGREPHDEGNQVNNVTQNI